MVAIITQRPFWSAWLAERNVLGCLPQPVQNCLFLDPFDSVNGSQTVALGQPGQALQNGLWGMMATIEHGAFSFYKGLATRLTSVALRSLLDPTELDDIAMINLAVIWTAWVPAEGTRRNQSRVFHFYPPIVLCEPIIHQHD